MIKCKLKLSLFVVLILVTSFSLSSYAANRRLATDCTYASTFTPSDAAPFDLNWCTLQDNDDITDLIQDIQAKWPSGVYVRAPSKNITVISDTIFFPTSTKFYHFYENLNASYKMTIKHRTNPSQTPGNGFWIMWRFQNFKSVKIGGNNLNITFVGNHPGLGNCTEHYAHAMAVGMPETTAKICDINKGLIDFSINDGTTADLAEFKANIRFAQAYALYTNGSHIEGATANKIKNFNIAGEFYATSGVFFHQGVMHAWADPNSTVFNEPYMRLYGWTGKISDGTQGGLPVGCADPANDQVRSGSFAGYYTDSITGGVTLKHGAGSWVQRFTNKVGKSVDEPFIVRLQDWQVSGPGTPYQAGVRVKKTGEAILFKGDPHRAGEDITQRFVRYERLTPAYGDGPAANYVTGCTPTNAWNDGNSNLIRIENNVSGTTNRGWDITFVGDWITKFERGRLFLFAWDEDLSSPGRVYNNLLRLDATTTLNELIQMYDTNTVTGAGHYANIRVSNHSSVTIGRNNKIVNTNINGAVTIDSAVTNTRIDNVNFKGAARTIITVGAGSDVHISQLCAPAGSKIEGTGTATYNGGTIVLPYTFATAVNSCSVTSTTPAKLLAPKNLKAN